MTTIERSRPARTEPAEIIPFGGWERTPTALSLADRETLFRFPAPDDPAPATARLLTMSVYASVLSFLAIAVGLRVMVELIQGAPTWWVPVFALPALASVALAVGSYLSIHRPALPWLLLLASSVPLGGDILATFFF